MKISKEDPVIVYLQEVVGEFGLDCRFPQIKWSDPTPVWRSQGRHVVLTISPNQDFFDAWDRQPSDLRTAGFDHFPPFTEEVEVAMDEFEKVLHKGHTDFWGLPDDKDPVFVALKNAWDKSLNGRMKQSEMDYCFENLEWRISTIAENSGGYKRLDLIASSIEIPTLRQKSDEHAEDRPSLAKVFDSLRFRESEIIQAGIYLNRDNRIMFWCFPEKIGLSDSDLTCYKM